MRTNRFQGFLLLLIITALLGYFLYAETADESSVNVYTDPGQKYSITPPDGWIEVSPGIVSAEKLETLPENIKRIINNDSPAEVIFIYLETDKFLGSNLNIINVAQAAGVEFNDFTYNLFKSEIINSYNQMIPEGYQMVDNRLIEINGIKAAYFENRFPLEGQVFNNIQVCIPSSYGMFILTYTVMGGALDDTSKAMVAKSYNTFRVL
jgi:hypothetical protein